ncbi:hypothetical protein OG373_06830 [Streptomyces avidinii]|uniref:hypothetical protein n=1 Tax=Streptomyces avidinii TaxID=1895 RepID=UPI003870C24D|nr:hypothetical protein OG373_06830 [Streptomyces avidinii]
MFSTYETVARETPARRATSALVGTGGGGVVDPEADPEADPETDPEADPAAGPEAGVGGFGDFDD